MLHDTVEMVGSSLFALTVNCARCHSHKFDPIPQRDYYRLMALFTPAYNPQQLEARLPLEARNQGPGDPRRLAGRAGRDRAA